MAALARQIRADPALIPLVGAVSLGVAGSLAFGLHYLRHNPDVSINKKKNPEPWNSVQPAQNSKLYSPNKDFWASRKDHPNPRSVFFSSPDEISSASSAVDKVKAAAVIKAKEATMAGHEEEKRASEASGMH